MIKNYLRITLRSFVRNRNYTLINVVGLSIGITACIIIFLIISNDLSFDTFHSKYNQIYRVVLETKNSSGMEYGTTTPYPFAKAFRNDFGDVPLLTQIHTQDEVLVNVGGEKQRIANVLFADSLFFRVFDFQVISGNPAVDLGQPGRVFLTKSLADRILKNGATTLRIDNKLDLEVAGIIADPPPNSHISFSMIVSMPSLTSEYIGLPMEQWGMTMSGYHYLVLPDKIRPSVMEERLKGFAAKYQNEKDAERKTFLLQPLKSIHFDPVYTENPGKATNASKTDLLVMGILGVFILSIACVNFINLATALAVKKSREIGIRKTLGAGRGQLAAYFLGETFLLTVFSVIISLCFSEWLLKWLNSFLDTSLELHFLTNPMLIGFLLLLVLGTTLMAGFYPSIVLSGYNPLAVLKNKIVPQGGSNVTVRKVLVVFQFIIAQVLIIGTLVMAYQMNYFRHKPLGFDKDLIITVPLPENDVALLESFKTRLQTNPKIENVSFSVGAPTADVSFSTNFSLSEKNSEEVHQVNVKCADRTYLTTFGLKLVAGRWFTEAEEKEAIAFRDLAGEKKFVYVLNEAAVKRLGVASPEEMIGKRITTGLNHVGVEVIGVVEDFHIASLHDEIAPVVLVNFPGFYFSAGMKISPGNLSETVADIKQKWSGIFPEYAFEYEFLDEHVAKMYEHDDRIFTMFKIFACVSIFIGCLGLYGLISFMAAQKLKEVGIRKVLGATVSSIVMLFSMEFIKLIVIAFIVAGPVAWYFMTQWLDGFAYRISMPWPVFIVGISSTLVIAVLTVSYRSLQAAFTNPAETLRSE